MDKTKTVEVVNNEFSINAIKVGTVHMICIKLKI